MRDLKSLISDLETVARGAGMRSRTVIAKNDAPYILKEIKQLMEQNEQHRDKLQKISELARTE